MDTNNENKSNCHLLDEHKKYKKPTKEECILAVNEWEQKTSATEYIWCIYQLNIRLSQIVVNKPAKYKETYGDKIICAGLDALRCVNSANQIFVGKGLSQENYNKRKEYFEKALSCLKDIMIISYIFLELYKETDGAKNEAILAEEGEIAIGTELASQFIKKIMRYDKDHLIR